MPTQVTYPLDLSGNSPGNLVTGELHSVNEAKFKDYFFIVPNFAPFFIDNFSATFTLGNVTRPLVEDVDFSFTLQAVTGTRSTGKLMYGGITVHNLDINGIITMNYQTIGGGNIADRLMVLTVLADKAYNPRTTIWDILNVPSEFSPSHHYQDYDDYLGQEAVVQALGEIRDAILQNSSLTQEQLAIFLDTINSGVLGSYLRKTGDTMTGRLILAGNPVEELEAVTKKYVDDNTIDSNEIASTLSNYHSAAYTNQLLDGKVNKSGDTMNGYLTLNGDPIHDLHPASKRYVDIKENNLQGQINNIEQTLSNLAIGHVTQEYVDSKISELMAYIGTISMNKG
jgi:hypothetical protein